MLIYERTESAPQNASGSENPLETGRISTESVLAELQQMKDILGDLPRVYKKLVNLQRRLSIIERELKRNSRATRTDLSPREKQVDEMRKQKLLHKEIAAKCGVSVGTIKAVTHRIRRKVNGPSADQQS